MFSVSTYRSELTSVIPNYIFWVYIYVYIFILPAKGAAVCMYNLIASSKNKKDVIYWQVYQRFLFSVET